MATSFMEAFASINLGTLEEGTIISEREIQVQKQIELAEGWLKLNERGASAKEKFRFATEHGFVSETHLNLWMAAEDEFHNKEEELDFYRNILSENEIKSMESEVQTLKNKASAIRGKSYYRMVMRMLKRKDVSPYGEDLLRANLDKGDTWDVDIERTIKQGYTAIRV